MASETHPRFLSMRAGLEYTFTKHAGNPCVGRLLDASNREVSFLSYADVGKRVRELSALLKLLVLVMLMLVVLLARLRRS